MGELKPSLATRMMPSQWQGNSVEAYFPLEVYQSPGIRLPISLGKSYKPSQKPHKLLGIITVPVLSLGEAEGTNEILTLKISC